MLSSKLFALNRWHDRHDHLDHRFFLLIVVVAALLHLAAMYIYSLVPRTEIVDVPVKALNIKLTDSDDMSAEELRAIEPGGDNNHTVETTVSQLVRDQDPENQARTQSMAAAMDKAMAKLDKMPASPSASAEAPAKPVLPPKTVVKGKFEVRQEGTTVAAPVMPVHQFVRDNGTQVADNVAPTEGGSASGHDTDMVSHYEQLISLWIQKFKLYPADARAQNMQGETVVRIRIDRHGNIRYYALEHSTGYTPLDRAAIDMIRRANPVPAVPSDYPKGELMEFLIPVSFHLEP